MAGSGKNHLRSESENIILRVEDLVVEFRTDRKNFVHAVSNISFDLLAGETLGIVGESGCGKSSTAKAIIQLPKPTSGSVRFKETELMGLPNKELRNLRPNMQMIYQDPISSLNPRRNVFEIVNEGSKIWGDLGQETADLIESVGLDPDEARAKKPHEYSGGQCQRISIARALALNPEILICDEPVSALDVSVQARIINLLEDMKSQFGLTVIFISHDLSVVKNISDRVSVMYLGKMCEIGDSDLIYEKPAHPYTRVLLAAIPDPDNIHSGTVDLLEGELPSSINPPSGCRFRTRCPKAEKKCEEQEPELQQIGEEDHWVACHFPHTTFENDSITDARSELNTDNGSEVLWPPAD
ncbi:MAG: peptide ABC transporter ATP-binding protein [Acidimicrobiaceae bacterium TMED130]|mgnify:CR=1 FL=1|nr:MAG: peptide ABC transporter ATP-binding protein [Acidimicrobiaceae bacterium TMED130]|tara:strand:- start:317 stop:1381 length:1065 start_codon:yes stop_codon:yes gene_type:complete